MSSSSGLEWTRLRAAHNTLWAVNLADVDDAGAEDFQRARLREREAYQVLLANADAWNQGSDSYRAGALAQWKAWQSQMLRAATHHRKGRRFIRLANNALREAELQTRRGELFYPGSDGLPGWAWGTIAGVVGSVVAAVAVKVYL